MRTKIHLCVGIVIIAGLSVYFYMNGTAEHASGINSEAGADSGAVSGMRADENIVVVSEQRPGTTITGSLIYLSLPGYLVIHEDINGEPGATLGASALLPTGESSQVKVQLRRPSRDGETLHAMLHFEKDGNSTFSAEDKPVSSRIGGSISGWFEVLSEAPDDIPVSI